MMEPLLVSGAKCRRPARGGISAVTQTPVILPLLRKDGITG
jgi:hypothetical protein